MGLQQFGPIGGELAYHAERLLGYMAPDSESSGGPSEWLKADALALENWLEIEDAVPLLDVFDEVDGEDRQQLHNTLLAFHTALPFNEAERGWLWQIHRRVNDIDCSTEDVPRIIEGYEDRIMMAGVRRVVSGRELMRRWIAWRRETDEFTGQSSLDQARQALQRMQDLVS